MVRAKKLTAHEYVFAIWNVAKETYEAAPLASVSQVVGALISAVLPIVTTYFAARTTTELAAAYAGQAGAGKQAITYVIITALIGILQTAWNSFQRYLSELMRFKVEAAMSDRMYEHFLSLDFWRYDDKQTADTYDRARDFARFFPYVFERVSSLFVNAVTTIITIAALAIVSWWISLIILIAIIPGIYLQFKLSRAQVAHRNAHVETRRSRGMLEWILGDQEQTAELRLYGLVKHFLKLRRRLRDEDERQRIEFERQYIGKQLAADSLEAAAEIIALIVTVVQIIGRKQQIGYFIYVQQLVQRALSSSSGFVSQLSTLDEDLANLFDYQDFMRLPIRLGGSHQLAQSPETIELRNVSFHYPTNDMKVLDDVSLTIKKPQHIALVGENGAGKSTLIKILTGLYDPIEGDVLIDGINLKDIKINDWHRHLGVLQQHANAYDFTTAKQTILFGDYDRTYDETRYQKAIAWAEAKTFLSKLPKGADSFVNPWMEHADGVKGVRVSGGQWQRLALARNFYRDSPIIILDEPTSAIDALAESRIFNHLLKDKKKTIITISHRLTTVQKADHIYMLENGKIVEQGTHDELVALHGAYYTMFESQLH